MRNHPDLPKDAPQWLRDADLDKPKVTMCNCGCGQPIWHSGYFLGGYFRGGEFRGGEFLGGYFLGGYFLGGYFLGGYFLGGYFLGGEFLGGEFRSGEFRSGEFRGGYFLGGEFLGGEFRSGEFRGGEFRGGEFRSGEFRGGHSAIRPKWFTAIQEGGKEVRIGCETRTIAGWEEFFAAGNTEVLQTARGTDDFKRIEATYRATLLWGRMMGMIAAVEPEPNTAP